MGRPPVGPKLEVRLPPDIAAEVERRAAAAGVRRGEMLRALIVLGLKR